MAGDSSRTSKDDLDRSDDEHQRSHYPLALSYLLEDGDNLDSDGKRLSEKGQSDRMVKALTRRIAISVLLILLVMLGIWLGIIKPHDLGR